MISKILTAKGNPLVVSYYLLLNSLEKILFKNLDIFDSDETIKIVFCEGPIFSFWSVGNVRSYLARSKVYHLERIAGLLKCNKDR